MRGGDVICCDKCLEFKGSINAEKGVVQLHGKSGLVAVGSEEGVVR